MERDGLSEERAQQRLSSQMSGADITRHAHLVLCTHWDTSYTQEQVTMATVYGHVHVCPFVLVG